MDRSTQTFGAVMRSPTAFLPLAMSAIALASVVGYVLRYSGGPVQDEGAVAHLWQLLMALQAPLIVMFAIRWLPRAPRRAIYVLAQQAGAALLSFAAVRLLGLG